MNYVTSTYNEKRSRLSENKYICNVGGRDKREITQAKQSSPKKKKKTSEKKLGCRRAPFATKTSMARHRDKIALQLAGKHTDHIKK